MKYLLRLTANIWDALQSAVHLSAVLQNAISVCWQLCKRLLLDSGFNVCCHRRVQEGLS